MSLFFPKRVKDLPPLEPDSDDDLRTPNKAKRKNANEGKNLTLPKRVSELPTLQSEDSDDEGKNDRLNCAILNDSFIVSPTRSIEDTNESLSPTNESNIYNIAIDGLSDKITNVEISRKETSKKKELTNMEQLSQINEKKVEPITSISSLNNLSVKPSALVSIQENPYLDGKSPTHSIVKNSSFAPAVQKPNIDIETPFKGSSDQGHFITPQLKSVQMSFTRRPRNLGSQSQKNRSAIENEFRTQKVLFQTPMSVARQPLVSLTNDSINLSLGDSIIKTPTTPIDKQPSPEIKDFKKSKKSSDDLFGSECVQKKSEPEPKDIDANESSANDRIVNINGKEYALKKKIGSGGSSSVFLAVRKNPELECALKIVDLKGDASIIDGYLNETKLLEKLQGNISVVSLYEYELLSKESKLFLVMEKGDSDLNKILQSYKSPLPLYVLMNFWYQMLQSVNYIHQNGVIHSDLKPANFLMVNGRLKLIDFGIASNISFDSTSIIKFTQAGTFNYISPEALIDTSTGNSPGKSQPKIKISTKSDVWSLGCILYLLLYQKTPFGNIKNIYAKVHAISNPKTIINYEELPNYYPQMLVDMAKNCLQHNPKQRVSVAELLQFPFHMVIPITNNKI